MRIHISCLVDHDPKFAMQAWNWLVSLKATRTTAIPHICHTPGALSANQIHAFEALGGTVLELEPFGTGNAAYCNKIQQLGQPELRRCDWLILSDADIAFATRPEEMISMAPFRAKPVDTANPACADLAAWLKATDIPWFGEGMADFGRGARTLAHNYNGGLYLIRADLIPDLAREWRAFARRLLLSAPKGARWAAHADQIGMACALWTLETVVEPLGRSWNFPTHFAGPKRARYDTVKPCRIHGAHYHLRMDGYGLPMDPGLGWIDRQLAGIRKQLRIGRKEGFCTETLDNFQRAYPAARRFPALRESGNGRTLRNIAAHVRQAWSVRNGTVSR